MDEPPIGDLHFLTGRLRGEGRSAEEGLEELLKRIAVLNPRVNALREIMGDSARREARRVDRLIQTGRDPGPLAGVPVAVKEIIDTTPAVCSAGFEFLSDYRPERDAPVVRRLRRAGAIIIGVAISDPGAFGVRTAATHHPQAAGRTVGGSSGGSGAALAAGFCAAALGTDTGGSIRIPAACCAIAGLKPTRGRVPTVGVRPLVWSLDHVGPMARSVADLTAMQRVLDSRFRHTRKAGSTAVVVGHDPRYYRDAETLVVRGMENALRACRTLGAEVREVTLPDPEEMQNVHLVIFCAESAAYYHTAFPDQRHSYPEAAGLLIELANRHTGHQYVHAMRQRADITRRVDALFDSVDVLLAPTTPVLPPAHDAETVELNGKAIDFTSAMILYTCLFDHTGNPVVAMPSAYYGPGIASSIQVIGPTDRDGDVLAFAERLEAALDLEIDYEVRL